MTITGVVLGVAGALALTRVLESMLFGVNAADKATFADAVLVLVAVAMVACVIPAWRAARIDPIAALRQE